MNPTIPLPFIQLLFDELGSPDALQSQFLTALMDIQNVERGSIWIRKGEQYICIEAAGDEADKVKGISLSTKTRSIVGSVISSGEMAVAETASDERHFKEIEKYLDVKNTLILCFPLKLRDGSVYGAVQVLDMSADGKRMNLDPDYLQLLEGLVNIGGAALGISLEIADQQEQNVKMKKMLEEVKTTPAIIGQSETLAKARELTEVYAKSDFPVMITGESGTGKELFAIEIHQLSSRRGKPFLAINCSAIPDTLLESELFGYMKGAFTGADSDKAGLFEAAHGGTVFLDEIGDMPMDLQAKMLRVLQSSEVKPLGSTGTRKVDVRIIAATNKNLYESVSEETFRVDLFYRLNVLPMELPPLRDRGDDPWLILNHFLGRFGEEAGKPEIRMDSETRARLLAYSWPGNIREMENLVKYLVTVTIGDTIGLGDLPPPYGDEPGRVSTLHIADKAEADRSGGSGVGFEPLEQMSWDQMEHTYIMSLLEEKKWNIAAAARAAGVKRSTFTSRMKKLGISKS
jgi:transcriptional regulator with GAF, ATPase, and Fis domain